MGCLPEVGRPLSPARARALDRSPPAAGAGRPARSGAGCAAAGRRAQSVRRCGAQPLGEAWPGRASPRVGERQLRRGRRCTSRVARARRSSGRAAAPARRAVLVPGDTRSAGCSSKETMGEPTHAAGARLKVHGRPGRRLRGASPTSSTPSWGSTSSSSAWSTASRSTAARSTSPSRSRRPPARSAPGLRADATSSWASSRASRRSPRRWSSRRRGPRTRCPRTRSSRSATDGCRRP